MLRQIILVRHAKSSWSTDAPTDRHRPLNKRGRRDAPRVGAALAKAGYVPEMVLSSDAARTLETYALMAPYFAPPPKLCFMGAFYLAGVQEVGAQVSGLSESVFRVMLLGHNDGWEEVLHWLSGSEERLTTANAAILQIEAASWRAGLERAPNWELVHLIRPRTLAPTEMV